MRKLLQAFLAVPISESIGRAFGANTMLGTGAALVTARFVLRSFPGMIALGIVAGGLNYLHSKDHVKSTDGGVKPAPVDHTPQQA
jgi:hypothetical protein